jgi:XTP/dITP diphosphohydrolase
MARRTLVIASRNRGKIREIRSLLRDEPVDLLSLEDVPDAPVVEEDGATFAENAIKKATAIADASGQWAIADDSGLEVDALGGRPGIRSARYSGPGATDERNIARLLRELDALPPSKRGAQFHAAVALAAPGRLIGVVEGTVRGRITAEPKGRRGFGYDPVFLIPSLRKTAAQLPQAEKNRISHRGRALRKLRTLIHRTLSANDRH